MLVCVQRDCWDRVLEKELPFGGLDGCASPGRVEGDLVPGSPVRVLCKECQHGCIRWTGASSAGLGSV